MTDEVSVTQADPIRVFLDEARRSIYPCPDKPDSLWGKWKAADEAHRIASEQSRPTLSNKVVDTQELADELERLIRLEANAATFEQAEVARMNLSSWLTSRKHSILSALRTAHSPRGQCTSVNCRQGRVGLIKCERCGGTGEEPASTVDVPGELKEFASLMVDELIAQVRRQLDEGQPLSLHDQKCLLEQLITDRERAALSLPSKTVELLREAREAIEEQVAECFDDRCEMCARHERVLAKLDSHLGEQA